MAKGGAVLYRMRMRKWIFSAIGGLLCAFCYVAGRQLDCFDTLDLTDKAFYVKWALAGAGSAVALYFLWQLIDRIAERPAKETAAPGAGRWKSRLLCAGLLFLCWLPALFSIFPGAFSYDAYNEWEQVRDGMLTAHHPVAHVLLLGGLTEGLHALTGNYNAGIAVYAVLQMLFLAWALSAVTEFMAQAGVPRPFRMLTLAVYALSPVAQLFSICATKDVPFTGAELFFFLYAIRFSADRRFPGDRPGMLRFGAAALCTMIFRNNGLYIVILTLLVLGISARADWRRHKRNLVAFLLVTIVPYLIYIGPVYRVLDVAPGGVEEMLSVPLQQMARVHRYDSASLQEEDLEALYRFVERESLEQYKPTVSDPVKQGFHRDAFLAHKGDFFRLWIRLGAAHPLTYVNSFLINTVDAWYPHALIDGYRHADGKGSYFDYRVAPPGEERVYLPGLHAFYERLSHDPEAQKAPLAFLLLSPGWHLLCTMVLFLYFWSRRKYRLFTPMWIFVFHLLTVLMGPMILVRYMLLFFFALPLVCAMALFPRGFEADLNCGTGERHT